MNKKGIKPKIEPDDLKIILPLHFADNVIYNSIGTARPVLFLGPTGVGKTEIIKRFTKYLARILGMKYYDLSNGDLSKNLESAIEDVKNSVRVFAFYDFHAGQSNLEDVLGRLDVKKVGKIKFSQNYPMAWVVIMSLFGNKENSYSLLFLDELTTTQDRGLLASLLKLLREKKVGNWDLGHTQIIAAGNSREDAPTLARELDPPILNRLAIYFVTRSKPEKIRGYTERFVIDDPRVSFKILEGGLNKIEKDVKDRVMKNNIEIILKRLENFGKLYELGIDPIEIRNRLVNMDEETRQYFLKNAIPKNRRILEASFEVGFDDKGCRGFDPLYTERSLEDFIRFISLINWLGLLTDENLEKIRRDKRYIKKLLEKAWFSLEGALKLIKEMGGDPENILMSMFYAYYGKRGLEVYSRAIIPIPSIRDIIEGRNLRKMAQEIGEIYIPTCTKILKIDSEKAKKFYLRYLGEIIGIYIVDILGKDKEVEEYERIVANEGYKACKNYEKILETLDAKDIKNYIAPIIRIMMNPYHLSEEDKRKIQTSFGVRGKYRKIEFEEQSDYFRKVLRYDK